MSTSGKLKWDLVFQVENSQCTSSHSREMNSRNIHKATSQLCSPEDHAQIKALSLSFPKKATLPTSGLLKH